MYTFAEAAPLSVTEVGGEAPRLATVQDRLAPGFVLGAGFEEQFYLTNNLPEQLRALFSPINPRRVDEDVLEALCDRAAALVRASYLLDDGVQLFYRALGGARLLNAPLHLRRDGETFAEVAFAAPPGNAVLFALKKLWSRDWTFDAVLARLDGLGTVGLEARPVLIFAGSPGHEDADFARARGWPRALVNERGIVGA